MCPIQLPQPKQNDVVNPKEASQEVTPKTEAASKVEEQLSSLANQMGEMNKTKKEEEEKENAAAKQEQEERLAAEADLKSLLTESEEVPEAGLKSRKDKIDDMTNTEILGVMSTAVETALGARFEQAAQEMDKKLAGTSEALTKICKLLSQMQTSSMVERARGKHADFDVFKDDTLAVLKQYPMMDVEDAYTLAKGLRTNEAPSANELESEKPIGGAFGGRRPEAPGPASREEAPKSPQTSGVVAFRDFLKKATDKVIDGKVYEGR